jgi:DoxX-like protein
MPSSNESLSGSTMALWAGRIISGLAIAFLIFDSVTKFMKPAPVIDAFAHLGWPLNTAPILGIILLTCVTVYVIPRTSIVGAILLTGYLGGAVATHLRVGDPLFSHILFPTYMGTLLWLGLYLRDNRLRSFIPLRY